MEDKKSTYRKTETLKIQKRDMEIFKFLNRVGYANLKHISIAINNLETEKLQATLLRRLYLLRRFNYIKTFSTHLGNYYALDKKGKLNLSLIESVKLDQLEHHDFLNELFFYVQNENVISEREVISTHKIIGKKGKIPDMIINDWIIEYERTCKSLTDAKSVVEYWTIEQGKNLCVIYETEEIKNKYSNFLNQKITLLARNDYKKILSIIKPNNNEQTNDKQTINATQTHTTNQSNNILDKYR